MGKHLKLNPETKEYDIPCTWKENVIATAENSWISRCRREKAILQVENMTEEEAERLCEELDREIESAIGYWRAYQ